MKKEYLFILSILLFSSCATILNRDYVQVDIHTPVEAELVIDADTFYTEDNFLRIDLYRQRAPVHIKAYTDHAEKEIQLRSRLSAAFLGSLFGLSFGAPFVEYRLDKIHTYPRSIYIDPADPEKDYQLHYLPRKGDWYLYTALPYLNNMLYHYDRLDEYRHRSGYLGFSTGLEYYYRPDRFVSISFSHTNAYENIGDPEDLVPNEFSLLAKYISIAHHHRWNRFSLGYGLSYQTHQMHYSELRASGFNPEFTVVSIDRHDAFALTLPAYIQLNSQLYLGFIYMPSIYLAPTPLQFRYEHVFTAEIAWKPRLFKSN